MISHTGMAILDVGMLSGFRLSPGAATPTDLIRKVEILPEKVSLYLDSVSVSSVCEHFMARLTSMSGGKIVVLVIQTFFQNRAGRTI